MADLKDFAEKLVSLSVKDVNELANILKDEYGIEPAGGFIPLYDDLPHMGDVENPATISYRAMFIENATVLYGHLPAGEIH